ncbi:hypothetical protein [Gordonia neofelifaecis]|uniref:Uncharacterized protein n=1 Tax=Gordonia neofelifaecis NRRL B-59395 TaxID=644548 RepID=F1YK88_9ACTN|nr:hypothetical protein [Gordonia neofelifaecis]EGD54934.1 hypothetical protein SCNU_12025 [Gordonia neofelifaecis NRRL B-59395]
MTQRILVTMPDDTAERLRAAIPKGEVSGFVVAQVERGLRERELRSMDDAVADIVDNDKALLDRLGNVH